MKNFKQGFAPTSIVLVILIVIGMGVGGYYYMKQTQTGFQFTLPISDDIKTNESPSDNPKETEECAGEGENFSGVFNSYPKKCCSGLTEWESGMDTRKVFNGVCVVSPEMVAGSPVGTCIKCGDGACGAKENICNCPDDCQ